MTTDILRDTVAGLNRRTSCIQRTYSSICGRRAASGASLRSQHQVKRRPRYAVAAGRNNRFVQV